MWDEIELNIGKLGKTQKIQKTKILKFFEFFFFFLNYVISSSISPCVGWKMGKMNEKKFMEMLIIWPNYSLIQINLWMVDYYFCTYTFYPIICNRSVHSVAFKVIHKDKDEA